MWTLPRYREWMESKTDWALPGARDARGVPAARRGGDEVIEIRPEEASLSDIVSELEKEG